MTDTDNPPSVAAALTRETAIAEQAVRLLFANARIGEAMTASVAIGLAVAQLPAVGLVPALSWLTLTLSVTLWRGSLRRAYQRNANARTLAFWYRAFIVGGALTGMAWGASAYLLVAAPILAQLLPIIIVIAGMTSAAVPYLAPAPAAFYAYAAFAVVPVSARFLTAGSRIEFIIGLFIALYLIGILRSGKLLGAWLTRAHGLAYDEASKARELATLTQALETAHDELRTESSLRLQIERSGRESAAATSKRLALEVDTRTAELRETLAAMTATREQLDAALVAGRLALFECDTVTREVRLSVHWSQMLGGPAVETVTTIQELMRMTHPDDRQAITRAYRDAVRGRRSGYVVDHRVSDANGGWLWVESRARVVSRRANGMALCLVGTNCDISDRKENEKRLLYQAYHDPLTGLANRAFLRERLREMVFRAERMQRPLAVLCLDLDHFKVINDSDGHAAGDKLLCAAAELLKQCVRQGDIVGRLGGDEFAVLLEGPLDTAAIAAVAQKIRRRISSPIRADDHEYILSASIGISCYPADGLTADELMTRADIAMYSAKEAGRNDFRFFTSELNQQAQSKATLMAGLQSAIVNDELWLAYQPRVDCRTDRVVSVEALLRWEHPELGLIAPERFIPLAELTGSITALGEWVLVTACAQMRAWRDAGYELQHVAVNLSMRQLLQDDLVERVMAAITDAGIAPSDLELEITESMAMQDPDTVLARLSRLHDFGVRIALDDFGTGFSSLSHLKRFPIDDLKIDRFFVGGVPANTEDTAIARAILALARSLELNAIAEGVETTAQRDFLLREGCREMQGFLFAVPVAAKDLQLSQSQRSAG